MDRILVRWYGLTVYSYSAFVCLGTLLAIAYVLASNKLFRPALVLDAIIWTVAGGLAGARLAYVASAWPIFAPQPATVLSLWGEGLVFQGGLCGGVLALLAFARRHHCSFLLLADLMAPGIALAEGIGWIGAHFHGAYYGLLTTSWVRVWLPNLYGVSGFRFPTQMVASACALALFVALVKIRQRQLWRGAICLIYTLSNGALHMALEFSRGDEAARFGALRVTQVAALAQCVLGAIILLYLKHHILTREDLSYVNC